MSSEMKITVVVNPRSGRGIAKSSAQTLKRLLVERGHAVEEFETSVDQGELQAQIDQSDRVVIIGGDGTVHHLLKILTHVDTPMYHLGTGTANLICKEFGMSNDPKKVVGHLEEDIEPTKVDVPSCNGLPFLIMVSLGIDASVIHRFEESRKNKGGYRAYIHPIVSEILTPRPARIEIKADDDSAQPPYPKGAGLPKSGTFVIANLRSYGGRFNPCPKANPSDGVLDLVNIKSKNSIGTGWCYGLFRIGLTPIRSHRASSSSFTITSPHGVSYVQVDGEKASLVPGLSDGRLEPGETLRICTNEQQIRLHAPG